MVGCPWPLVNETSISSKERDGRMRNKNKGNGYYCCGTCGSMKRPDKTGVVINLEYQYRCPDCKHIGPFEEFLPEDTMRYLFC